MNRHFSKPSISIDDQISLLQSRGIQIIDKELAAHYLKYIGYYRLSGYANYFKTEGDKYREGTTFEQILEHYIFDRKLKIILFDAIERIEIALKNIITTVMSERYGAFWFTQEKLFINNIGPKIIDGHKITIQAIRKVTVEQKNKDTFLKHYYDTYNSPELPPSWMVMETLPMGAVSRILSLLIVEERKCIAKFFNVKERHLVSWMRSLTYTRNLCAHHSRVWNRIFTLKVEADKRYSVCREEEFNVGKIYSQTVIIAILLSIIAPENHFEQHINELFYSYKNIYKQDMGFPMKWENFKLL